jgi:hypothetical protein
MEHILTLNNMPLTAKFYVAILINNDINNEEMYISLALFIPAKML